MNDATRAKDRTFTNYMVVLLVFAALVAGMVLVVSARQEEHLPTVDYRPDATLLAENAPYTAYVPEGLPADWRPTSSRLDLGGATAGEPPTDPVTWDVGFATPSDEYASLRISDADPETFVAEMTEGGEPDGTERVDGQVWERYYSTGEGRRSLVRSADGATLVVTGTAEYAELAVLAAALEPR